MKVVTRSSRVHLCMVRVRDIWFAPPPSASARSRNYN